MLQVVQSVQCIAEFLGEPLLSFWCYCYGRWHTENFSVYVMFLKYVLCSNWRYVAFTLCSIKFNNWILVNGFHISVLLMWCKSFRCCTRNCFYLYFVHCIFWLLFQGPHDSSECILQDLCCINETVFVLRRPWNLGFFFCVNVLTSLCLLCTMIVARAQLVCKGCGAAAFPENLRKIALNIWVKVFVRRYVHSLKEYELINFKFKYLWWTLKPCGSYSGLHSTQALHAGFSTTRPSGGRLSQLGQQQAEVYRAIQGGICVSMYLYGCFKCWHFDNHFYLVVFKIMFANLLILVVEVLR